MVVTGQKHLNIEYVFVKKLVFASDIQDYF
ncbi:hypothetical protein Loa_00082 [Legionella oakridgensis ATCC 33761 = DSM 21215]|uniref:Uncharacterized protein n=1 Tax=Legionella oakridgensis ATCC 33761 = DSM 21215 TaxID=1268635 RepID=W0B570_9GAMM|nr:hypothetical protein Loa_00082 [Legionella oakridgensis ATCC 33761 = DSM 21215]ETO94487.1 hypothetical protein LOR_53c11270 [Legionella oakridgensis RV-2-2007]STY15621.1 Uncharacterised protein [Legionella longbeachae]